MATGGEAVSTTLDSCNGDRSEDLKRGRPGAKSLRNPPPGSGSRLSWALSGYPESKEAAEALQREGLPDPDVVVVLTTATQEDANSPQDGALGVSQSLREVYGTAEFVAVPEVTQPR